MAVLRVLSIDVYLVELSRGPVGVTLCQCPKSALPLSSTNLSSKVGVVFVGGLEQNELASTDSCTIQRQLNLWFSLIRSMRSTTLAYEYIHYVTRSNTQTQAQYTTVGVHSTCITCMHSVTFKRGNILGTVSTRFTGVTLGTFLALSLTLPSETESQPDSGTEGRCLRRDSLR